MPKSEWTITEETINKMACLKHRYDHTLTAFGKKGYVWIGPGGKLKVARYRANHEEVTTHPIENIKKVFNSLEIPKISAFQVKYSTKEYVNNLGNVTKVLDK